MKIRAISTHFVYTNPFRNWLFVKVDTDEGIHGWGEASVEGKEKTVAEAIHELERQLIGRDPFQIELLWQEMYRNAFWVGGPILTSWYEERVPSENVDAMALVARATDIPIATGEHLFTKWGFKDVLEKQAAAVIQPDICHDGGILETRKIAALAEVYYVGLAPHNPNGPLSTAACIHVDASSPNFLIQEYVISDEEIRAAIQKEPLPIVDGYLEIPNRPGLGVDLDEAGIARSPYQATTMGGMLDPRNSYRWDKS